MTGEDHYNVLRVCQNKSFKNIDTLKETITIPTGSMVAIQCEDGGPWTHGTIIKHGDLSHNGNMYRIWVSKTGCIITQNARHVKMTSIMADQYL